MYVNLFPRLNIFQVKIMSETRKKVKDTEK